jgi:beta-lactamase regulating signal transducer with metallopeptidase domain
MSVLVGIALKSLLIGGLTLALLFLMRQRSAAERSWVAHVGLLALVIMAFAPLVLPSWDIEAPAVLGRTEAPTVVQPATIEASWAPIPSEASPNKLAPSAAIQTSPANPSLDPLAVVTALYALPAAILLFITFLALARLVALQARAEVVVDGRWLSALARAQRRMGFKHGTALLTSNELASPISWGLMRPVILLNRRAVEARQEAEAIIAHELAHVARLDWAKLLLARVATALFWFNPLVWLLAREAHQLREETADDTVLAADIADTDYAQLLVGVARHECPGLLLGAHGVAPSKSSLARRVARVLDGRLARGPAARGFALGVLAGAVLVAAPLAALTLTPAAAPEPKAPHSKLWAVKAQAIAARPAEQANADLPHIIARGVSTSVSTAMAAVASPAVVIPKPRVVPSDVPATGPAKITLLSSADGATVSINPFDSRALRKMVLRDRAMASQTNALEVSPEYVAEMRAAAPQLAEMSAHQMTSLRAVGVTPDFARALAAAGFSSISAGQLMEARAVGLSGAYVNAMRSAGVRGNLGDFIELRAVGVDPGLAARALAAGIRHLDSDTLIELQAIGPGHMMKVHVRGARAAASASAAETVDSDEPDADPGG